jgi:biopolymer transport protein TolQ
VTFDWTFLSYFMNAGFMVKLVMLLLVGASILSWTYILQRGFYIKNLQKTTQAFENQFWSGGDLSKMYTDTLYRKSEATGLEAVFRAGFKEFLRLRKQGIAPEILIESSKRAMRVAQMHEQDKLEAHLPLLATVGSTSPYVGLFGTVWGIMISFKALASVQQATISMVAPGIAEALIATAMGLFAAIPAVVAYNRYATEIGRILNRFDAFQDEFTNILFRQAQSNSTKSMEIEEPI